MNVSRHERSGRHRSVRLVLLAAALGLASPAALQAQSSSLGGTVTLDGQPPSTDPVRVTSDQRYCGDSIPQHAVRVRKGGVANTLVWLEGASGEPQPRRRRLLNRGCRFVPRVLGAAVGDTLVVVNEDSLLHNVNLEQTFVGGELDGRSRTIGNFSLPLAGMEITRPDLLRAPGRIRATCDAHGWMRARIRVFDHPFFAVTDARGNYSIDDVPPGTYTLHARHEMLGSIQRTVTVQADSDPQLDLELTSQSGGAPHASLVRDLELRPHAIRRIP